METFDGFDLQPVVRSSLARIGYTTPTAIQAKALPVALQGRDILGSSQTGSGKTAAFAIPLVNRLLQSPDGAGLILTPTRELATQVCDAIRQLLSRRSPIKMACLIGGDSMHKQLTQLKHNPRIIVGTPGRINDHLERETLVLHDFDFLVLDETDRMLDMGFSVQLERIFKYLPKKRQTLMFSATLPKEIVSMSKKYLNNPEQISNGKTNAIATNITQKVRRLDQNDKYDALVDELNTREGTIIVFMKTKFSTEKMAKRLNKEGFKADSIHGNLRQGKRNRVISDFRKQKFRILVATDVAARGLDIPHIEHVINFDLPQSPEDYIHRVGRTARAGAEGSALCFISPQESAQWYAIECLLDPSKKSARPKHGKPRGGRKPFQQNAGAAKRRLRGKKPGDAGKPHWKEGEKKSAKGKPHWKEGDKKSSKGKSHSKEGERSAKGKPHWKEGERTAKGKSHWKARPDRQEEGKGAGANSRRRPGAKPQSAGSRGKGTGAGSRPWKKAGPKGAAPKRAGGFRKHSSSGNQHRAH